MTGGDLFDYDNREKAKALARNTDHSSSHRAARESLESGTVMRHEGTILVTLANAHPQWRTAVQIADQCELNVTQIRKRTQPLVDRGLIEKRKEKGKHVQWRYISASEIRRDA